MKSSLGKRILAMGLAIVLASTDVLPTFAEELNTEVPVEENIDAALVENVEEAVENGDITYPEPNVAVIDASAINDFSDEDTESEAETVSENDASDASSNEVVSEDVSPNEEMIETPVEIEWVDFDTVADDGALVRVSLSDASFLPEGAGLSANLVTVTSEMVEAVDGETEDSITEENITAYDIHFAGADGVELELPEGVTANVSISMPEMTEEEAETVEVFHFDEEAVALENMGANADAEAGEVAFETGHFSVFVIVKANSGKTADDIQKCSRLTMKVLNENGNYKYKTPTENSNNEYMYFVRIYEDNVLKEFFPEDSKFYYTSNNTLEFEITDVIEGYDVSVKKGTFSNQAQSLAWTWIPTRWASVSNSNSVSLNNNKYTVNLDKFKTKVSGSSNENYYKYNYIDIYLTKKPDTITTLADSSNIKVVSGSEFYKDATSSTDSGSKFLKLNVYVDGNLAETFPKKGRAVDNYYKLYSEGTKTYTLSNIKSGYEISEVKLSNTKVDLSSESKVTLDLKNGQNTCDIYLTKVHVASPLDDVKITLVDYDQYDSKDTKKTENNGKNINYKHDFWFLDHNGRVANGVNGNQSINNYTGSSGVHVGIVENKLVGGYPKVKNGESLSYLFSSSGNGIAKYANNLTGLFTDKGNNYYEFDSSKNYAYYNKNTNSITLGEKTTDNAKFTPFNQKNETQNFYFGMQVDTSFVQPASGKIEDKDMVFTFAGDDDVWVFVDDILVLDLGGVHQNTSDGTINFANGTISYPKIEWYNNNSGQVPMTLYDAFKAAGVTDFSGWKTKKNSKGEEVPYTFGDLTKHTFKMFYFERGAGESNCKILFNLSTIPSDKAIIGKNVECSNDVSDAKKNQLNSQDFTFEIKANGSYVAAGTPFEIHVPGSTDAPEIGTVKENGTFTLKNGQLAYFDNPVGTKIEVAELKSDANEIYINGEKKTKSERISTGEFTIADHGDNTKIFKNVYLDNGTTTVDKKAEIHGDPSKRIFQITLSASYNKSIADGLDKDGKVKWARVNAKATIRDSIDSRFVPCTEDGTLLANGAEVGGGKLCIDDDKAYVEWSADLEKENNYSWSAVIYVKAQDDFLGGNDVYTNGADSYVKIEVDGEPDSDPDPTPFPKPRVNVTSLKLDVSSNEETLFLGEDIDPKTYVTWLADSLSISGKSVKKLSEEEGKIDELISNGSVTSDYAYNWVDPETKKEKWVFGKLTYNLTCDKKETHTADKTGNPYESYSLKVSYTPDAPKEDETKKLTYKAEASESNVGKYDINVVDGSITVLKKIKKSDIEWTDGDPIFTFRLENKDTHRVLTKVVHFTEAPFIETQKKINGDYYEAYVTFEGLGKGNYDVVELSTLGYEFESMSNEVDWGGDFASNYSNVEIVGKNAVVSLGKKKEDNSFVDFGAFTVINKKLPEYFMDRDEKLNEVTFDENGNPTVKVTNSTEEKKFTNKDDFDAYVAQYQNN